ncbi:MAG: DUF305 domain-containing protein [Candidatus Planktophila sp.]|nr:DUF305 domain-containing protein [Candidatus Planktophila sp.]
MKRLLAAVVALFVLTGCAASPSADSPYSSNDLMFAQMMIPHHEQAIEMSDIALTNSSSPEILQLAQEIKDAQAPEIQTMRGWLGDSAEMHSGHSMDGMLSEAEMSALRDAEGVSFDRLFLEGMIAHHEGAIKMAQDVVKSKNAEVAALATAIIDAQQKEIAYMQELLKFF